MSCQIEQTGPDSSGRNSPRGVYEAARPVAECARPRPESPASSINEIVLEKRGITADTALRLARYFDTTAEMWTGLQADYDLRLAA